MTKWHSVKWAGLGGGAWGSARGELLRGVAVRSCYSALPGLSNRASISSGLARQTSQVFGPLPKWHIAKGHDRRRATGRSLRREMVRAVSSPTSAGLAGQIVPELAPSHNDV